MERGNDNGVLAPGTVDSPPCTSAIPGRSRDNGPAPAILAQAFFIADGALRARILGHLLDSAGTLALAVIGGGAFFKFLSQARSVSADDAVRVTSSQVFELASYVQQSNPAAVEQVLALLLPDVATMSALGASVAAIVIGFLSRRTAEPGWPRSVLQPRHEAAGNDQSH